MESLPRGIILDILSRLPVTSLLQSKLVCKAWNNLVKDPLLVCMHFSRATKSDPCLILHCDNQLHSLELSDHCKDDQRVKKIRMPVLPKFDEGLHRAAQIHRVTSSIFSVRIWFQSETNKYKVIQAVYGTTTRCSHRRRIELSSFQVEVQILTLGSPAWRNLGKLPYHRIYQGRSQVLVCGRIHRCARSSDSGYSIISFDFEDEQFREVPKPDYYGWPNNMHLVDFGGCLAAVSYYSGFEIWIMKEYDVKESWIKEFKFGKHVPRRLKEASWSYSAEPFRPNSKFYQNIYKSRVVGLLKNSKVLLEYRCRDLVTYDPKDGTFKNLTFPGMPYWFEVVVHA